MHAGRCLKNFKTARVLLCELVASIFHSEVFILHCTQNQPDPKLKTRRSMKTSEFDKIPQSLIKMPEKYTLNFSVWRIVQNGKLGVERSRKYMYILRGCENSEL